MSDSDTARRGRKDRPLGRGVARALLGPANLSVAAVASGVAALMHSLPVLAAGGAAYLTMVTWDLTSEAFWKKVDRGRGRRRRLRPAAIGDEELRRVFERIVQARAAIDRAIAETPPALAAHVLPSLGSLEEIEDRSAQLAAQGDQVAAHLRSTDAGRLRAEVKSFGARAQAAADAGARREFVEARTAREEQLRNLDELAAARERVVAHLSRILAALEALPTRLVKMRALDDQAVEDWSASAGRELDRIKGEMGALEEALSAVVEGQQESES